MPIKFKDDWDTLTRINYLQRRIIVASIIYYEWDYNVISDYQYDDLVQQLKALMDGYEDVEKSRYWYVYKDWTGATGAFLYPGLTEEDQKYLVIIASHVVRWYQKKRSGRIIK
jgi:hypothetical protein